MKQGLRVFAASVAVVSVVGCASQSKKVARQIHVLRRQVVTLQKQQDQDRSMVTDLQKQLADLHNSRAELIKQLADLNAQNKKLAEAQSVSSDGAQALMAQFEFAVQNKNWAEANRVVKIMDKGFPESPLTAQAWLNLADQMFGQKRFAVAASLYQSFYLKHPDNGKAVSALFGLGLCHRKLGMKKDAIEAFRNVIRIYPGSEEALKAKRLVASAGRGAGVKE